jgi:hypothetical protein
VGWWKAVTSNGWNVDGLTFARHLSHFWEMGFLVSTWRDEGGGDCGLCIAMLANRGRGVRPSVAAEGGSLGRGPGVAVEGLIGVPCLALRLPSGVCDPWCGDGSGVRSGPGDGVAVVALGLACR